MKKIYVLATLLISISWIANAQQKAINNVKYMVTYDEAKTTYTAWVVPNYRTPNFNNPDSEEKGATAQFSLKVPQGFVMKNFQNLKGDWDKNASKIGSEPYFKEAGLSSNYEYYIIGKTPTETNYGVFEADEPVALFSFQGNATDPREVSVLENTDEFVDIAYNKLSLNVASSFYSRSGQSPKVDSRPLEQFTEKTTLKNVFETVSKKLGFTEIQLTHENDPTKNLIIYPNPAENTGNIKFYSLEEGVQAKIELLDLKGVILHESFENTSRGFNTVSLDISKYPSNTYVARIIVNDQIVAGKLLKNK